MNTAKQAYTDWYINHRFKTRSKDLLTTSEAVAPILSKLKAIQEDNNPNPTWKLKFIRQLDTLYNEKTLTTEQRNAIIMSMSWVYRYNNPIKDK